MLKEHIEDLQNAVAISFTIVTWDISPRLYYCNLQVIEACCMELGFKLEASRIKQVTGMQPEWAEQSMELGEAHSYPLPDQCSSIETELGSHERQQALLERWATANSWNIFMWIKLFSTPGCHGTIKRQLRHKNEGSSDSLARQEGGEFQGSIHGDSLVMMDFLPTYEPMNIS